MSEDFQEASDHAVANDAGVSIVYEIDATNPISDSSQLGLAADRDQVETIPTGAGEVPFERGEQPSYAHLEELPTLVLDNDAITSNATPDDNERPMAEEAAAGSNVIEETIEQPPIPHNDIDFDETHYYRLRAGTIATLPIDKYVSSGNGEKLVAVLVEGGIHAGATFPVREEGVMVRYEPIGSNRHISRLLTFKKMLPGDELGSFRCTTPSLVAFIDGEPVMSYDLTKFDQAAFNDEFISVGADDPTAGGRIQSWTGTTVALNGEYTECPMIVFKRNDGSCISSLDLQHGPAEVVGQNGVAVTELIAAAILALQARTSEPSELDDASVISIMAKLQEAHDAMDLLNKPAYAEADAEEDLNED